MDRIYNKTVSYNLGKNILFDKVDFGENFLILYNNTNNHKHIIQNFMRQMSDTNSILVYISHKSNQLNFNFEVRNCLFSIISENIIQDLKAQLDKYFDEMENGKKKLLLIADWSNANLSKCGIFLPFLESLIKKSQGLNPPGWRRRYKDKGIRQKTPFMLVNLFETVAHDDGFIHELIKLHQRVFLLQENFNTFLLPTISPSFQTIYPKTHVLPNEVLEKLVKDNLELVMLLLLEMGDKSGYQILKEIAGHFHCILSQGTLYPLLYQLEKENKIVKKNGKGREIIYSLSAEMKKALRFRLETCLEGYQHLASFFENGGGGNWKKIMRIINKMRQNGQ